MFEKSVIDMESGTYLGDIKVVDKLIGEFINAIVTAVNINVVFATCNRYADIFLGLEEPYKVIPDWNDKEHLGRDLARRLSVSHLQSSVDVFRAAFGVFARYALTIVKETHGKDDDALYVEVISLKRYMTAVLLGTASTLYPNDKGWQ
jgi:hypothetical protein